MEVKPKRSSKYLDLINIPIALTSVFCFFASILLFTFCVGDIFHLIILIPLIGIFLLTIYYLKLNTPFENINRLILIDIIIFLFYLIAFYITF